MLFLNRTQMQAAFRWFYNVVFDRSIFTAIQTKNEALKLSCLYALRSHEYITPNSFFL